MTSSYILQPSSLGVINPRSITKKFCDNPNQCGSSCEMNTTLDTDQTNSDDICCHYNKSKCCSGGCGQEENMSTCSILSQDCECSKDGHEVVCVRPCKNKCLPISKGYVSMFSDRGPAFQQLVKPNAGPNGCEKQSDFNSDFVYQNCIYDTNAYKDASSQQVQAFKTNYCPNVDPTREDRCGRNHDEIMVKWCSAQVESSNCPSDPISGQSSNKCARYVTVDTSQVTGDGETCRQWINDKKDATTRHKYIDAVASEYCSKYNTNECLCINRGLDKQYQETKSTAPMNDGCWWNPCVKAFHPNYYFKPSDVDTEFNSAMCPQNICASFNNVSGFNESHVKNNQEYIDCDF